MTDRDQATTTSATDRPGDGIATSSAELDRASSTGTIEESATASSGTADPGFDAPGMAGGSSQTGVPGNRSGSGSGGEGERELEDDASTSDTSR